MTKMPAPWINPELLKGDRSMSPLRALNSIPSFPPLDYDPTQPYWPEFCVDEERRGTKLVDTDERGRVQAALGEEKRIATFGLGGCSAVAVAVETSEGVRNGYVQHYNPANRALGIEMLEESLTEMPKVKDGKAVIMVPARLKEDMTGFELRPIVEKDAELLADVIQQHLGIDFEAYVYGYPMERTDDEEYSQGTLMIEFGAGGKTNIYAESTLF